MIPLTVIQRLLTKYPENGKAYLKKKEGQKVFIYSRQWDAYWRPEGMGYTDKQSAAGVYDFKDAIAKTYHCGPEKGIYFEPVKL